MSLRWGFKAEAERIAAEIRCELSLTPTCRLRAEVLARHLGIPVFTIRDCMKVGNGGNDFACLIHDADSGFSALTVFVGTRRVIVHNESHAPTRQANNIVHEISHCLLEHPAGPVADAIGCRRWNEEFEDEANWLSGALLVPRDGALSLVLSGSSVEDIAENFGVSQHLCRWRINRTGVAQQVHARSRWLRRTG